MSFLPPPTLTHACDLDILLGPPVELGGGRGGRRRIIPILGGTATGRLCGRILPIGADWQILLDDSLADLDARYAIATDDGATIEVRNSGFRHGPPEAIAALARGEDVPPDAYTMRTQARLETGDPRHAWVNHTLFVGTGARRAASVHIAFWAIG
jgi:hypothetical protein